MKNSIILYKKILLSASKSFNSNRNFDVKLSGYSDEDIFYSIKKLGEMGIVDAMDWSDSAGIEFVIRDITSLGWEIISKLKNISDDELITNYQSITEILYRNIVSYKDKENLVISPNDKKKKIISVFDEKEIWKEIANHYDISKIQFGRKINFVNDKFKRKIIFRDVAQSYYLTRTGCYKTGVILAGGVIEELLKEFLIKNKIKPKNNTFDAYIKCCEQNGLLKSGIGKLSDSVREFRNLVHINNEKSERFTLSKASAISAVSSIFVITNDF